MKAILIKNFCACVPMHICTYVHAHMCGCQRLASISCHSLPCFSTLTLKHIDCLDTLEHQRCSCLLPSHSRVRIADGATVSFQLVLGISHHRLTFAGRHFSNGTIFLASLHSKNIYVWRDASACLCRYHSGHVKVKGQPDGVFSHLPHVGSGESNSGHWASAP